MVSYQNQTPLTQRRPVGASRPCFVPCAVCAFQSLLGSPASLKWRLLQSAFESGTCIIEANSQGLHHAQVFPNASLLKSQMLSLSTNAVIVSLEVRGSLC